MTKEDKVSATGRRFSVQRKMAVVARLLRGEPLELVARKTDVSLQKLTVAGSGYSGGPPRL